ncbi:hypothetical protein NLG97_g6751 [Lecanicillium saksenae]|uniref:Uncharacterized protein n=1 Tax=Lecanicillium saksenae TaxID=468837 RepID=A0ACC1QPW7_9HYPO|nr:hypothetical protein NLG97_g6751 [Lecanicillium saksenae]
MSQQSLLDPSIFASLETKLEEETQIRDSLTQILQRLERSIGAAQGLLTKVHSTPRASYPQLVTQLEAAIKDEVAIVAELNELASKHPYYKSVPSFFPPLSPLCPSSSN